MSNKPLRVGSPGVPAKGQRGLVWLVASLTFSSGLFNLYSLVKPGIHRHTRLLEEVFPLEFIHFSRFLILLLGFALSVASLQLFRRKRRAYQLAVGLSIASIALHLTKGIARGLDYEHAIYSALVLGLLVFTRRSYTVGSGIPRWKTDGPGLAMAVFLALAYGVAGFWFLDRREFGIDFTVPEALRQTLRTLSLVADPEFVPQTRHARWFLSSLQLITISIPAYVLFSLFQPVLYRFRRHPQEQAQARAIVQRHGRTAADYFKLWPDKSYLFSPSRESFVAYRAAGGFAVALGDPVGPEAEMESMVRLFLGFCRDNDWGAAFHQTLPDLLPVYRGVGLKKLKVGDEAVIDLTAFDLNGKERKDLRHKVNQLERAGIRARFHPTPVGDALLARAREVSDAWLAIPGRRERTFTLGAFDEGYLRSTPLFTAEGPEGDLLAFANIIPSYAPGESTCDLMRYRPDAPKGIMEYLFIKLFVQERERGFERFNLGLAPMTGFQEREEASAEERAVHLFFQHLNFLFSYQGLRLFKAKFASRWEPRYVVFRSPLDLPRLALALSRVSSVRDPE
jgi:phosphatidylglycerol lysyltransferase